MSVILPVDLENRYDTEYRAGTDNFLRADTILTKASNMPPPFLDLSRAIRGRLK